MNQTVQRQKNAKSVCSTRTSCWNETCIEKKTSYKKKMVGFLLPTEATQSGKNKRKRVKTRVRLRWNTYLVQNKSNCSFMRLLVTVLMHRIVLTDWVIVLLNIFHLIFLVNAIWVSFCTLMLFCFFSLIQFFLTNHLCWYNASLPVCCRIDFV